MVKSSIPRLFGSWASHTKWLLWRSSAPDGTANPTRAAIAQKIFELAKAGELDPERLCGGALKAMQPMAPVLISDPQSSRFTAGAAGVLNPGASN